LTKSQKYAIISIKRHPSADGLTPLERGSRENQEVRSKDAPAGHS